MPLLDMDMTFWACVCSCVCNWFSAQVMAAKIQSTTCKTPTIQRRRWYLLPPHKPVVMSYYRGRELVETQVEYIKSLKKLVDICNALTREKFNPDTISKIFGQNAQRIEPIMALSSAFLCKIYECEDLSEVFASLSRHVSSKDYRDLYIIYCLGYPEAIETLHEKYLPRRFPKFRSKLSAKLHKYGTSQQELNDLLIQPVQRISRYRLMVEAALKDIDFPVEAREKCLATLEILKEETSSLDGSHHRFCARSMCPPLPTCAHIFTHIDAHITCTLVPLPLFVELVGICDMVSAPNVQELTQHSKSKLAGMHCKSIDVCSTRVPSFATDLEIVLRSLRAMTPDFGMAGGQLATSKQYLRLVMNHKTEYLKVDKDIRERVKARNMDESSIEMCAAKAKKNMKKCPGVDIFVKAYQYWRQVLQLKAKRAHVYRQGTRARNALDQAVTRFDIQREQLTCEVSAPLELLRDDHFERELAKAVDAAGLVTDSMYQDSDRQSANNKVATLYKIKCLRDRLRELANQACWTYKESAYYYHVGLYNERAEDATNHNSGLVSHVLAVVKSIVEWYTAKFNVPEDDKSTYMGKIEHLLVTHHEQKDIELFEWVWTSCISLKELVCFCSIINSAIRADEDGPTMAAVVAFCVPINARVSSRSLAFSCDGPQTVWRGAHFDNTYQGWFNQMIYQRYRVPGLLSTSSSETVAKDFAARNCRVLGGSRVLYTIHLNLGGRGKVAQVQRTGARHEKEYLFAPFAVFRIKEVVWSSNQPSQPHKIVLSACDDTNDDLPLAPWY